MKGAALSLQIGTSSPTRVARRLEQACAGGTAPTAGIVFVSGALAHRTQELADLAPKVLPGATVMIVAGAGTMTEQGERERVDSASVILWKQGKAVPLVGEGKTVDEGCVRLADQLRALPGVKTSASAILFARPDGVTPGALSPLASVGVGPRLFGGGTVGGCDPIVVGSDGRPASGPVAALLLLTSPPRLCNSPACRLLCSPMTITRVRGSMVLELDREPALEVLNRLGRGLPDSPLVFAVLGGVDEDSAQTKLIRAVQGVDPIRGGLMVSEEVFVGRSLTFGVRDAPAARADLERGLREMEHELAGAAPVFGLYVNCAGRGSSLYGVADVDSRLIRSRFEGVPVAGIQSSFEIVPMGGAPSLQLYSGVMALYTAPS